MALICRACEMLTEPMSLFCEFCGKSPHIADQKEFNQMLAKAQQSDNIIMLEQLEILKSRYFI